MEGSDSGEIIVQGVGVSPGIAIGQVHIEARGLSAPDLYETPASEVAHEQQRFENALKKTLEQLDALQNKVQSIAEGSEAQIFEAHRMIISDTSLTKKVLQQIEKRQQNAEAVFYSVFQNYIESMRRVNDPYLSERASDLTDICQRVLRNFSDAHIPKGGPDHQHILVAYDLSPSDTAVMDRSKVLGFATEQGSVTSHTAILARSLGIPAIVELTDAVMRLTQLDTCILDGKTGKFIINPSPKTLEKYEAKKAKFYDQESKDFAESRKQKVTQTADGHVLTLSANIEFSHETGVVRESGAEGIGLFRTEFFLLNGGEIPSEQQQYEAYKEVAEGAGGHLAIIRTLDAGGDKLSAEPLVNPEPNPFLGWRGIRVSLSRVDMFKDQLRAILRASAHGKIGVMFPLISGMSEVRTAKDILKECMKELDERGVSYDEKIAVGVMIEVPSAAMLADKIAEEVDFFSIGTNDLVQYTIAVDRVNPEVSHLYKPCHPAVIRLIKMTVDAGCKNGIWTGVCGEMAGMLDVIPLLLGLGVDELSVGAHQLPRIKQAIGKLNISECRELAEKALSLGTSPEIRALTTLLAEASYPELMQEENEAGSEKLVLTKA